MADACYVCDTPLQVFNALNLFYHHENRISADIIIVNQFRNAEIVADKVKSLGLFNRVMLAEKNPTDTEKVGRLVHYYHRINDMMKPEYVISKQLGIDELEVKTKFQYKQIYASIISKIVSSLLQLSDNIDFYLYDDGLASYIGDITQQGSKKNRLLSRLLKKGVNAAPAKALYVNNVKYCMSKASNTILPLPKIDRDFIELACNVFNVSFQRYENKKIVILTQPKDGLIQKRKVENIIPVFEKFKECSLVRFHPRDEETFLYDGFDVDHGDYMWELRPLFDEEFENLILIGPNSTAQLTPKLLYDKEPILIFTHYFWDVFTIKDLKQYDMEIEKLHGLYRKKKRIFIPHNTNELADCISTALVL